MTPLKLLILRLLLQHGPMLDVELWQKTDKLNLSEVTMACIALESDGLIEVPRGSRPVSFEWQLTDAGRKQAEQLERVQANG